MSSLTINTRRVGSVVVLDLNGQIRIGETNRDLHTAVHNLVAEDEKQVLLNLANVTSIDSSGLGELVASHTSLERIGGEMKLLALNDRVVELMMITKLLTVFDVFEKEDVAIASFGTDAASAVV